MTYRNDIIYVTIIFLSSCVNLEQENKILYRRFLVMDIFIKELDIAIEPYREAEIAWNLAPNTGLCLTNTTNAKKVDIRKLPFDL